MRVVELLDQIRSQWIDQVSHELARGESVRESFLEQMSRYYNLMRQAIISGDPAWLNEVLDEWTSAQTLTEREQHEISLAPILTEIIITLSDVASESLNSDDALDLINAILPLHTHALEYSSRQETEIYVQHIADELGKARISLERLDKSKSDFIAVAAHELKTPLTLIEGYASMLDSYLSDEEKVKTALLLNGVNNGVKRLQRIIDDMIDVSLIDNDLLQLNFQAVWINQLLGIAHKELANATKERSLNLIFEEFPGCNQKTFGDPERLYQALWNILTNAVKYTPDNGTIRVSGRKLPGFIEITITDTGIGIVPESLDRIFEKFAGLGDVSLHSSGKTKFKGGGPGLGLPITKGIIEAHGGSIWVESQGYDEETCPGSTFHVLLPIRKETPDEKIDKLFSPEKLELPTNTIWQKK
ncbi:MAG: HAMP domain-containing sensor histidine kinase [Chloroflexota bacterium]|nr:HAMP domain-containing sensor histidine kinase [Chloroflexota bacterium]